MIAIIDYGVGNLFSLKSSLREIGAEAVVTSDEKVIAEADRIILPGVGAFEDAARKLRESGMAEVVKREAAAGKPMMGICLGMQLLFEKSYEYGEYDGLGYIKGCVVSMRERVSDDLKVPQIGWNDISFPRESRLFKGLPQGSFVYFVHSFYLEAGDRSDVAATTEYGVSIDAAVEHGNLFACQFHPEKSERVGMQILENFLAVR